MRFAEPGMLWLLLAAPALALFIVLAARRRAALLRRFAEPALLPRLGAHGAAARRWSRALLAVAAVALLALALARPQWGSRLEMVQRKGLDIVIAVDVSQSMLAEDIRPSRLARSKQEIQRFVEALDGDRVGLVAFAGDAFLQSPLTSDYAAFRIFLDVLDPSLVGAQGTDLARALETAVEAFPEGSDRGRDRVIILLTDGEDHGGRALRVAEEAARAGILIHTVGVGSETGAPVPLTDASGRRRFLRDRRGEPVSSRLDATTLAAIARAGGGAFHHARPGRFELPDVLRRLDDLERAELETQRLARYEERYQWPLAAALLLLALETLVADRPRRRFTGLAAKPEAEGVAS